MCSYTRHLLVKILVLFMGQFDDYNFVLIIIHNAIKAQLMFHYFQRCPQVNIYTIKSLISILKILYVNNYLISVC